MRCTAADRMARIMQIQDIHDNLNTVGSSLRDIVLADDPGVLATGKTRINAAHANDEKQFAALQPCSSASRRMAAWHC